MPVRTNESPQTELRQSISLSGLLGGLLGAGMFSALALAVLIDPGDGSRWWSAAFLALACGFIPAILVSVRTTKTRDAVLRFVTIGCLIVAISGTLIFGPVLAFLLAPPTALLAVGAKLIWQGGRPGA